MTQDFLKEDISLFKNGVMSFEAVSLIKRKKKSEDNNLALVPSHT